MKYKGLSTKEAESILHKNGPNELTEAKKKGIFIVFFEQFQNFLVLLLLFAAIFSLVVGEMVEGSLIMIIVILNAVFGVYQERKAEQAIYALKDMTATMVRVIRDGNDTVVDSKYIVPDDIIKIEEGNKIAADAVILSSMHLEVNESALTGESYPVSKKKEDEIAAGTIVTKGRAIAHVTKTGMETQFGQIAANLSEVEETKTPLQRKLGSLTKVLGGVGIFSSILIFLLSYALNNEALFPSILLGISVAVAVVPEGLPAVMTVTMAMGVKNMANRKAIMRKLSAVEALGNITLIATDKTGTLTTNVMKVKELWIDGKVLEEETILDTENTYMNEIVTNGVVCSTANLAYNEETKKWNVIGDPTEGALLYLARDVERTPEDIRKNWTVLEEYAFDSVTKRMMVTAQQKGTITTFTKGAPEAVLDICTQIVTSDGTKKLTTQSREKIQQVLTDWAKKGLRVLAFSTRSHTYAKEATGMKREDLAQDQTFLGMVAIHDAPRPEVADAIKKARTAGIETVMITGDNPVTAEAVGRSIGLMKQGDKVLTGAEIDTYDDQELKKKIAHVRIYARTTPFHKSRLVKLYQERGEIVASTGDGVNDAIALKQADVGVAMGLVGTDVTREAADMVITDDNFSTIVNAVEEGRNIIQNIRNVMQYLLSTNAVEVLVLVGGLLMGIPHIVNALMLLFINLITDGVPALMLAFSPRDPRVMEKKSTKNITLLRKVDYQYIIAVSILGFFVFFLAYFFPFTENNLERSMIVFCVLVLVQTFTYLDVWVSHNFLFRTLGKFRSPYFVAAVVFALVIQSFVALVPAAAEIFKVDAISPLQFGLAMFYSSLTMVGLEVLKVIRYAAKR